MLTQRVPSGPCVSKRALRGSESNAKNIAESGMRGTGANQQPAASSQQPAASSQQPATSNQQPATSNQEAEYLPLMPEPPIKAAVRRALEGHRRIVLAVSGGIDSMVLLD